MDIIVSTHLREFMFMGQIYSCRIGREGACDRMDKVEGDFKSPRGSYAVRYGFYRKDRLPAPPCKLLFHPIRSDDGWCDDPNDPAYNQPVRLPYPASAEQLLREDGAYDVVIVLGHNDSPPVPGLGSAIFLHIAHIDDRASAGCIAVSPDVMAKLLLKLSPGDCLIID